MKKLSLFPVLAAAAVLVSCSGGSIITPASTGSPYEVLIVADAEHLSDQAGLALVDVLQDDVPGLPQSESSFKISKSSSADYYRTLRFCRNIVMVNIDDKMYTAPKIKFSRNVYSDPQIIVTVQAPDAASMAAYVKENGAALRDLLTRAEMNREIDLLSDKHNLVVEEKVRNQFGCEVWIPQELNRTKTGKDFFWASSNGAEKDLDFVIYSYPYRDLDTFTPDYFFNKRDSVMKVNIPGPNDGQYMTTARPSVTVSDVTIKGRYAQLARGLWEMENYDMGGPFVSVARVDEMNQRVIVVEAFVYAPGQHKRNMIRRMEAALYTLALPDELDENRFSFSLDEVTVQ